MTNDEFAGIHRTLVEMAAVVADIDLDGFIVRCDAAIARGPALGKDEHQMAKFSAVRACALAAKSLQHDALHLRSLVMPPAALGDA